MNTDKVLVSLQLWLRAGIERSPDTREVGAGAEGHPSGVAGGDEVPSPELLDAGPRAPKVDGDLFCALRGIQDVVLLGFGKPAGVSVSALLDGIQSILSARAGVQMSRVDATGGVAAVADDLASRDLSYVCFIGNPMSRGWPSAYVKPWIAGTMEMPKPDPASSLWNLLYTSFYVLAHGGLAALLKVQIQLLNLAVPRVMKPAKDVVEGLLSQAHLRSQLGDGRAFP
jgi:hypothetical protein